MGTLGAAPYVQEALRWLPGGPAGEEQLVKDLANEDLALLLDQKQPPLADRAHVLLADDNRDMREYVQRLLGRKYKVTAVEDGEQAMAAALAQPPDLVLTDVMMPRMDGFHLLRSLRDDPVTAAIPVIMLSARAGEEAESEGLEAGADDYLVKPFTARELMARVGSHISIVPAVHALRGELHQTFSNLISNAIDAMRDGGGQLTISVQQARGGNGLGILVTIEDTGTGIPSENIPRLFEPFFTTKTTTGTGLGLWVVRQFVASWGGTIEVKGSTDA